MALRSCGTTGSYWNVLDSTAHRRPERPVLSSKAPGTAPSKTASRPPLLAGSYDRSILDLDAPRGDAGRASTLADADLSGTLFVLDGLDDTLAGGGTCREETGEDTYKEAGEQGGQGR